MISLARWSSDLSLINPASAQVLLIVESSSLARSWLEAQRDESEKSELTSSSPVRCNKTKRTAISSTEVIRVFGSVDVDKTKSYQAGELLS